MSNGTLPTVAPAGWKGWCTDVQPFILSFFAGAVGGCGFIPAILPFIPTIHKLTIEIDDPNRPLPTSTTEMDAVGFWLAFLDNIEGLLLAVGCVDANGESQFSKWTIFDVGQYCQGPFPEQAVTCQAVVGFPNLGTITRSGGTQINSFQAIQNLSALLNDINLICAGPTQDFTPFVNCCQQTNSVIQSLINMLKGA